MPDKTALQAFIEQFVGGRFNVTITAVTLTTSATKVLEHNFERMAAAIIVTGSNNATVAPQAAVTASNGVLLGANGGNLSLSANEDLALVGWEWYGVSASATTTVTTVEITRYKETSP